MNANNQTNIDEFGRDISLRNKQLEQEIFKFIEDFRDKMKTMSWAEICYEEDEAEEEEQRVKNNAKTLERKTLLERGQYELEEGEVLE